MTDNQNDAASLLDSVKQNQDAVKFVTQPGGAPDFIALLVAQGLGTFADPRHVGYSTPRLITGAIAVFALLPILLTYMRRRHNLGGSVGLPTWIGGGFVFVANVVAFHAAHGDAREVIRSLAFGIAAFALGTIYRSAPLFLLGGVMAIAVPAANLDWPVALWLPVLVVWVAVVGFLGRTQLIERAR
jgi:hypothetical protein